jgi:hypothetical protein
LFTSWATVAAKRPAAAAVEDLNVAISRLPLSKRSLRFDRMPGGECSRGKCETPICFDAKLGWNAKALSDFIEREGETTPAWSRESNQAAFHQAQRKAPTPMPAT